MVLKDDIIREFEQLNFKISNEVAEKCLSMCREYNFDAVDFADQWYAYSATNLKNDGTPTIEELEKLERKEFQKIKDRNFGQKTKQKNFQELELDNQIIDDSANSTVGTPKNDRRTASKIQTPVQSRKLVDSMESPYLSSPGIQSAKYNQRTDALQVKCSFGLNITQFKNESNIPIKINLDANHTLPANTRYMYEVMSAKARALNSISDYLGQMILDRHGLSLSEGLLKNFVGEMTTYGRIVSDSDHKINNQSLLLEGTYQTNMGHTVQLNVNKVSKYSLFPGQVVAVKGRHVNNNIFVAEELYDDVTLELPLEPPVTSDTMDIVIAAGPFTLQNNLLYEPLTDILKYVIDHKPHVLILVGPFLEANHESIYSGELVKSFDAFFEDLIANIMITLQDTDTHVMIVASQRDAHHHCVYPTMPYQIREKYKNLTFVPDPCLVDINGLVIGATSVDVLFDIGNFEIYLDRNPSGQADRMARIANHLLKQQSFYPLYPTNQDVFIDHEMLEKFGNIDVKPHVMILPSNLRHFIKNIDDCLVINPERLTKGYVGGTFARLRIKPGSSNSVCDRVTCQVLKI